MEELTKEEKRMTFCAFGLMREEILNARNATNELGDNDDGLFSEQISRVDSILKKTGVV